MFDGIYIFAEVIGFILCTFISPWVLGGVL